MEKVKLEVFETPLSELNPSEAKVIPADTRLASALEIMKKEKIGSLLLHPLKEKFGIVTEKDFVQKVTDFELQGDGEEADKTVADIAIEDVLHLTFSSTVKEALDLIETWDFRHIPLGNDSGQLTHMLSARDLLKFIGNQFPDSVRALGTNTHETILINDAHDEAFSKELLDQDNIFLSSGLFYYPVRKAITNPARFLDVNVSVKEALSVMRNNEECLVVNQYETLLKGIVTERDFLTKAFGVKGSSQATLGDVMTANPHYLLSRHKLAFAVNNMIDFGYRHIIIVDEDHIPLSCIGIKDILAFIVRSIRGASRPL